MVNINQIQQATSDSVIFIARQCQLKNQKIDDDGSNAVPSIACISPIIASECISPST